MNILYINHYAGSIHHGMEYRPYYLAREWVKLGHKVTIVASNYSHLRSNNVKMSFWRQYLEEDIDGIKYIWLKTPKYTGNGFRRVINIFAFLKQLQKLIPQLVKNLSPQLVIASSTYPFDTRIAYRIAQMGAKAKFVYEVHDLWPLTPIELGGMSKFHPYIWSMQMAENFGYRHADKVVSLLPKADTYMQQHGMKANKFVHIPNGVCIDEWQQEQTGLPEELMQRIAQIRRDYQFLIGYAGGMGESNALDYLVDAAIKSPNVAFVLVGDGANKEELIEKAQLNRANNIYFLPRIEKKMVPAFLSQMDALYIGWNNLPIYRFGISPNKLFDYMLAAKPILHSVTAGNDLVATSNCGISVPAEDVAAIVSAIESLRMSTKEQLSSWGQNGREYVKKHHDYSVLAKEFLTESGVASGLSHVKISKS